MNKGIPLSSRRKDCIIDNDEVDDSMLGCGSIVSIFGRLFETFVGHHLVFDGNENMLDGGCFLPGLEKA